MEVIRTLEKEFDVGERCELEVENRSGTTSVRGDESTRTARIEVVARLWADDDREADDQATLIERAIDQDGRRIKIRAPSLLRPRHFLLFTRGARIDYQITLPRDTSAKIDARSGRVEIERITGPVDIEARSGRVVLREIAKDVTIAERSGTVQAEELGGSLRIESRSGTVHLRDCRRDVQVVTTSGSVQAEDLGAGFRVQARSGAVRYHGDVRGHFDIDVTSGSVRLGVPPDAAFFLDAEAVSGSVRSDLPMRDDDSKPAKGGPTVRVRTASGSIHITPR